MDFFQYNNVKFCILALLQIIADSLSDSVSDHVMTIQECNVNVCGKMFVTNELTTDLVVRKYLKKIIIFLKLSIRKYCKNLLNDNT